MIPSSTFTAFTSMFMDMTSISLTFSSQIILFWQVICSQSENNQCEYTQMVSKLQHGAGSGGSHPSQLDGLKQTIWPISICSTQGAKPKEAGSRWARSLPRLPLETGKPRTHGLSKTGLPTLESSLYTTWELPGLTTTAPHSH